MAAPYDNAKLFRLTVKHLASAIALIECCFTEIDLWEHPRLALPLSVCPSLIKRIAQLEILEYWVAVCRGAVVGISGLYVWTKSAIVGWAGWTTVDPNYRKQGIGSKLINHVGAMARERSLELRVMTSTRKYPIAARLYESRGIHIVEMPL